jgi:hypothetical protein
VRDREEFTFDRTGRSAARSGVSGEGVRVVRCT